jgi:fatty acid desaturase
MSSTDASTHEQLLETMTGGMVHGTPRPFMGSDLLRDDGRPRPEFRASLRDIANVRNAITVISVVVAPLLIIIAVSTRTTWWSLALGIVLIGMTQTRMYILHHEAAHRLLFSNRTLNDIVGINIHGWLPLGTGTHHYRRGHANHHRGEFGPNEPDFLLYAFYPIARVLIAPYSVGYHMAHHVDSGVPFRNLPVLHRALQDGGYFEDVDLWPSYTELWKALIRSQDEAPS